MNIKAYKIAKRSTLYRVAFYLCLLIKLLILGERPKRLNLTWLVTYENVWKSVKRDLSCRNEVSRRTILRAMRLHNLFWDWLLKTHKKHPFRKEILDSIWETAFRCGHIPPKLKRRVKELVLATSDIKGRRDRLAELCELTGLNKRVKVYRGCRLDEDKLNDGEFGYWWTLDVDFAVRMGLRRLKKGKRLALYSVVLPLEKMVSFSYKSGEHSEIILFNITRYTPTLKREFECLI